jgi:hypothetical protein
MLPFPNLTDPVNSNCSIYKIDLSSSEIYKNKFLNVSMNYEIINLFPSTLTIPII